MQWLVRGAQPNDSLFFHCESFSHKFYKLYIISPLDSGHGGQTKDLDGDEADGYDEGKYVDCQNSTESHRRPFKKLFTL